MSIKTGEPIAEVLILIPGMNDLQILTEAVHRVQETEVLKEGKVQEESSQFLLAQLQIVPRRRDLLQHLQVKAGDLREIVQGTLIQDLHPLHRTKGLRGGNKIL